jgi:hypothetical protein
MDWMPDREFHPIFDRTSKRVNFKGAGSPAEIDDKMKGSIKKDKEKIKMINEAIREGYAKKGPLANWKRKIRSDIKDKRQLIFAGFARRTIDEAIARPQGRVALTLRHGYKKAKAILLERAQERIGPTQMRQRLKRRW